MFEWLSYLLALTVQYVACVMLYRASDKALKETPLKFTPSLLKLFAVALLLLSTILLIVDLGFERGVTIAIGLIGVSGFASLFIQAYAPRHHSRSGFIASFFALIAASSYAASGGLIWS